MSVNHVGKEGVFIVEVPKLFALDLRSSCRKKLDPDFRGHNIQTECLLLGVLVVLVIVTAFPAILKTGE